MYVPSLATRHPRSNTAPNQGDINPEDARPIWQCVTSCNVKTVKLCSQSRLSSLPYDIPTLDFSTELEFGFAPRRHVYMQCHVGRISRFAAEFHLAQNKTSRKPFSKKKEANREQRNLLGCARKTAEHVLAALE